MEERSRRGRYLDVSEYILKEYSPMSKAMNADLRLSERVSPFTYEPVGSITHHSSSASYLSFYSHYSGSPRKTCHARNRTY